ncbi:hypothetical protein PS659_06025 [Pseudomonas fluorescens]|uniref:Uncharacterized protein n=1 Tax=Pseudomonas fluorescens TaxID=294 RepID=A0A5E6Y6X9_PSEFL|nr:hypothetical protein PS659_06025 [Pseudomonas fluorescens]
MEGLFVGVQIDRLGALHQHLARMQRTPGQPAAQRQGAGQRSFGALPGRRQMVAMHRQNQRVAFFQQLETQVGTFGDDPLIAHQALKAFGQGPAGHQGITGHMELRRPHHLAHVQADGRVAGQFDGALPQPCHGILREARIRIIQCRVVEPQLLEQNPAIQAVHLQRFDNPHRPASRSRSFAHGVFLHGEPSVTAIDRRILKWRLLSLADAIDHSRLK